jgi:hypothetical protein
MAAQNSWDLLKTELAELRNDQKYEIFRSLLDHLEHLVNQPKDERDRDFARSLLAIIKKLPNEWKQGIDVQTQVESMSVGGTSKKGSDHHRRCNLFVLLIPKKSLGPSIGSVPICVSK